MKFICSTASLIKNLQLIIGVIPSKSVIQITDYFLFSIEDGTLSITATDLEISMRVSQQVEARENGRIAIPSKLILDILKTLPEQPITFDINEEDRQVELTTDQGKYKIAGESADDFPKFPSVEGATSIVLPSHILSEAISSTQSCIGTDEMRPAMTGLFCQVSPSDLRFVSTDGNRLVLYKRLDASAENEDSFLLPRKVLGILKGALPTKETDVNMFYNRLNAQFSIGDTIIICRLIDERFPDYKAAIPTEATNRLRVNRQDLVSALKRLIILANQATCQIKFNIDGSNLELTSSDFDFSNEGFERLNCDFEGDAMTICFNGKFLSSMLTTMAIEEVDFELTAPNRPGVIKPSEQVEGEELLMLLMPIVV